MGCDIHCYIEIHHKDRKDDYVDHFGKVRLGRNYLLFALMADVRNDGSVKPVAQPKGLPPNSSFWVTDDYCLWVTDKDDDDSYDGEGHCSRKTADGWVNSGSSVYMNDKHRVTNPDWHSASWLTIEELEQVQREYVKCCVVYEYKERMKDRTSEIHVSEISQSFEHRYLNAIIATMKALKTENNEPRLVIWFDN